MFEDFECGLVKDRVAACGVHIFGRVGIDATALLNFISEARLPTGLDVSINHAAVVAFCASPWDFELDVEQHAVASGQRRAANESAVTRPRPNSRLAEWNETAQ